jgi:hypothetical protein
LRANGAIQGGASAFTVGDSVIVAKRKDPDKVYVVGHVGGIKPCSYDVYLRLYLNGTLAEYGGEDLSVWTTTLIGGPQVRIKDGHDPLSYGITHTSVSLLGIADATPITIRLSRTRTVGALLSAAYDALGTAPATNPSDPWWKDQMYWGYMPYDVTLVQSEEAAMMNYDYSYTYSPPPPPPVSLSGETGFAVNNIKMVGMSVSTRRPNYILLETTVGAIKAATVNVTFGGTTIKVFDVRSTLPDFKVLKRVINSGLPIYNTFYSTPLLSGSSEANGTKSWNNGVTQTGHDSGPGDSWISQDATCNFSGKPVPEIDDHGVVTWSLSYSTLAHTYGPPDKHLSSTTIGSAVISEAIQRLF